MGPTRERRPAGAGGAPRTRRSVDTHCPYCSLQCGMTVTAGDRPAAVEPLDFPTNRGGMCSKGWASADLLDHPERLLRPLVRARPGDRTSPLVETELPAALDAVAAAVRAAQAAGGPDAVGVFGGGGLTNEKAYQLGKFARVGLGTSAIDYNGRFCMSSSATAGNRAFGVDRGLPFPLSDIERADVVLLVGGNPAHTMPPAMQWFDAGRARGARHVVVDPRATPTARGATLHLAPVPGTDLVLALGILARLAATGGVDEEYVRTRTTGFSAALSAARRWSPDRVERVTGVPAADLVRCVELLAGARTAMVLTARGAEQHATGTDTAAAFVNVALALGLPGRPGSGYGTITGQGNGQGGREHGQKADQLPGYRLITDPAARAHVAAVWGVEPDSLPGPGRSAVEMLDAIGAPGGVRAMLLLASNPVVSAPDSGAVAAALARLDTLVVSDFFLSETAALADVVLPAAMWAEEDGTMTNLEGRVIRRRRALDPPAGVLDDLAMVSALADRLGCGERFSPDPAAVFEELRRASAGGKADYAGITWERVEREQGVFWPCPDTGHPGTPRLFAERFATPDGLARFARVQFLGPTEAPDREYPYVLTTGRTMQQYQSGTQTRRTRALDRTQPEPFAELHPDTARRHGVDPSGMVRLTTRRGTALVRARVTESIGPGTVFVPFHWGGTGAANALTDATLDPWSRMPSFKACAVAVAPAPDPPGETRAGSAAGDSGATGHAAGDAAAAPTDLPDPITA